MNKLGLICILIVLTLPFRLEAEQQGCDEVLARILSVQGTVEKKQLEAPEWIRIENGSLLCANETIRTLKKSRATVEVINETIVSLDESTTLLFSKEEDNSLYAWLVDLFTGKIFLRSREPHRLKVNTPFINAAHEGTEFMVTVDDEKASVLVFDGQVAADNPYGKVTVKKGQQAIAFEGQAPQIKPIKISPEDAVQWMLYYPPILNDDVAPASPGSPTYFNQQAATLLNLGRVEEAQSAIDQAKSLAPENANSLALEAVIAVTKNRADRALDLASQAVKKDSQSAAAHIAHSYAQQAKFKLEDALKTMEKAVKIQPDHAIAWARLAELQLSMGDQDSALESAQTAEKLDPTLARTQIILGFADLAQVDIDEAQQAFEQAIQLDSTDPLARLGLGLAKIRRGDVEEGTRDMEAAVSLDPDNAVMRSYLGKAYYELKNTSYATTELAIAKEKDPKDPTPWFYDAILKQTTNRPVEALHDMQKAIELNDNRAVYRSSLLLDEDLAARSAALGRIYNDLGFQRRGLVESWKSLNTNPTNYSAHRFLADNYSRIPRHQIARVSELLQSQLLQPLNVTPIQPQLAESNMLLLSGLGPVTTSFNEFNPLYTRNQFTLQTSGLVGGNNTWSEDVVHSGLWNKWSYSIGQFHYETDGYRENNKIKQDLYNAFIQGQVTKNLNTQLEYRYRDLEHGDLSQNWNLDVVNEKFRRFLQSEMMRLGLRYSISSADDFLLSLMHLDEKETTNESDGKNNFRNKGYLLEGQNLYQSNFLKITFGGGYYQNTTDLTSFLPFLSGVTKSWHSNGYFYGYLNYPNSINWTLGFGVVAINDERLNQNKDNIVYQVNPKFGLVWNVSSKTTIRLALFRNNRRSFLNNQTIEPTQIAGFNQLFDDNLGTDYFRYGIGIDHAFTPSLFSGIEISARNLRVPEGSWDKKDKWREQLLNAYINWNPLPKWSFKIAYEYERFKDIRGVINPNTNTHLVNVNLNYFHPSGFFSTIGGNYVNQRKSQFNEFNQSNFGLLNFSVGFRLPKRYGIVSLEIKNLLDKKFNYQGLNFRTSEKIENGTFQPERVIFSKILFNF